MCEGSLREGAPDGVGWRSTRNNGLRTYNEIKIHCARYSFRQPLRSLKLARVATSPRGEAFGECEHCTFPPGSRLADARRFFCRVILSVVEIRVKRGSNEHWRAWDLGKKSSTPLCFAQDDTAGRRISNFILCRKLTIDTLQKNMEAIRLHTVINYIQFTYDKAFSSHRRARS